MSIQKLAWALIAISVLCFIFAVIGSWLTTWILGIGPEAFSRASGNLSLIAIALLMASHKKS
jgi:hypothetical protein